MKLADSKRIVVIVALVAGLSSVVLAQVKNDAIKIFNEGVELMKANDPRAIDSFESCIKICEQVGDSANDIKAKAVKVLPDLYYQKAFDLLTVDKMINESLSASKKALEVANKYSDAKTKENAQKLMVQAYSTMATAFVNNKENAKAIQAYDSVLMINPEHMPSIYNKALVYKTLDNAPKFEETIDLYLEKLKPTGDTIKIEQSKKIARDYFRIAGSKANQGNKLADAITLLNKASKYGFDKNVYYQFASVYNKQKKFALAAENAQKGLSLETGKPEDKAKFYFELAEAQNNLGKKAEACTSYQNAMYGPFMEAAKAQRTNLKCQ
jgi:tetratricopeptide (TPR) repeat protein